ncbi:ornithine carbamoyltransferase [secondary endosymbiont of Trabutina mannipara]|uniref:ornithine carbamoyltransferase n=1 Tax=secondary endosymbiont of Trabutina mannipara TaxID=1835721 RepID=UPI0009F47A0D|nr:ornithine carbamoyltransferase [secondary endosymbiont of Trabutina mannipara]
MNKLVKRNFLRLMDFTSAEINQLLALATSLKYQKRTKCEIPLLAGKNIALIFEKDSTRTRCSFEVAAFDQGARVTYLGLNGSHIGYKESIKDSAIILGRMYDAIQYRGYDQSIVEKIALYAGVPVWNGLTNEFHPTQVLADMLTMQEFLPEKKFNKMKLAYVGDARNNISNTLLEAAALTGINLRIIAPSTFWPNYDLVVSCRKLAHKNGGNITLTQDIATGVKNVDFIYTDVWVSMGEDKNVWQERIEMLRSYQINMTMLHQTGNSKVKFLHCLPAFHNKQTIIGKQLIEQYGLVGGIEVTNDVFESPHSVVFDQAENRLHTIKAVMVATLVTNIN